MNELLLSYRKEDRERVEPLAAALEAAGFRVQRDEESEGWQRWVARLASRLESAPCALLVCSQAAANGVEDTKAAPPKKLLPVRIDDVAPPRGLPSESAFDLVGWNGDPNDPRFQSLVTTAGGMVGFRVPSPWLWGLRRLHLAWSAGIGAMVLATVGFLADARSTVEMVCGVPGLQTACAAMGLAVGPSAEELAEWEAVGPADCQRLKDYFFRYPNGAFAEETSRRLEAAKPVTSEEWMPALRTMPLVVGFARKPLPNESAAKAETLERGHRDAARLCASYDQGEFRLRASKAEVDEWTCEPRGGGVSCRFEGEAVCEVDVREVSETLICPE